MAAGLKHIKDHIRAVSNIKKITTSMKMVSATKYLKAEKNLIIARPLGLAAKHFLDLNPLEFDVSVIKILYCPITSDRGLCGSMPSRIFKQTRSLLPDPSKYLLVCLGEKTRLHFVMDLKQQISLTVNGLGHKIPTFKDASLITNYLLSYDEFILAKVIYGHYINVVSFNVKELQIYSPPIVVKAKEIYKYENEDDMINGYMEFSIAVIFFYTLSENYVVELASRMNAMNNASKNAGELSSKLKLQYNRLRQQSVTRELIDIVSGAQVVGQK